MDHPLYLRGSAMASLTTSEQSDFQMDGGNVDSLSQAPMKKTSDGLHSLLFPADEDSPQKRAESIDHLSEFMRRPFSFLFEH